MVSSWEDHPTSHGVMVDFPALMTSEGMTSRNPMTAPARLVIFFVVLLLCARYRTFGLSG